MYIIYYNRILTMYSFLLKRKKGHRHIVFSVLLYNIIFMGYAQVQVFNEGIMIIIVIIPTG